MLHTHTTGASPNTTSTPTTRRRAIFGAIFPHSQPQHDQHSPVHPHLPVHEYTTNQSASEYPPSGTTAPNMVTPSARARRQNRISTTFGGPGSVCGSGSGSSQSTSAPSSPSSPLTTLFETLTQSPTTLTNSFPALAGDREDVFQYSDLVSQHPLSNSPTSGTSPLESGTFGLDVEAINAVRQRQKRQQQGREGSDNDTPIMYSHEVQREGAQADQTTTSMASWSPTLEGHRARFTFGYDDKLVKEVQDAFPSPPSPMATDTTSTHIPHPNNFKKDRFTAELPPLPLSSSVHTPRIHSTSSTNPAASSTTGMGTGKATTVAGLFRSATSSKRRSYLSSTDSTTPPPTAGTNHNYIDSHNNNAHEPWHLHVLPVRSSSRRYTASAIKDGPLNATTSSATPPSPRIRTKNRLSFLASMLLSSSSSASPTASTGPNIPTDLTNTSTKPLPPVPSYLSNVPLSDLPITTEILAQDSTETVTATMSSIPPSRNAYSLDSSSLALRPSTTTTPINNNIIRTRSHSATSKSILSLTDSNFLSSAPTKSRPRPSVLPPPVVPAAKPPPLQTQHPPPPLSFSYPEAHLPQQTYRPYDPQYCAQEHIHQIAAIPGPISAAPSGTSTASAGGEGGSSGGEIEVLQASPGGSGREDEHHPSQESLMVASLSETTSVPGNYRPHQVQHGDKQAHGADQQPACSPSSSPSSTSTVDAKGDSSNSSNSGQKKNRTKKKKKGRCITLSIFNFFNKK
ncbi:hypothetical protein BC939DRAFT_457410 [Gamsiella multidivaricata]|uniref:uncharacterized protein n=1 Tax=Gamsiella multidivaricata TaxID=101098 RepID=UPI00221EA71B|nr:uncharacterized protein BC939DRAFT_457410 [Gamsiella multidivaricata]KAI7820701.1 hypothetical protein BC939DRAFT_457410 [Gamsiella multidivaricata]